MDEKDYRKEFQKKYNEFDECLPKECHNCRSLKSLTIHHIVPLVLGGTNRINNLCRLCEKCHGKVHSVDSIGLKELQRIGIERAKKEGKYTGRKRKYHDKNESLLLAVDLYKRGNKTVKEIINITKINRSSFYEYLKNNNISRN
jgi:hypothetical protein